MTPTSGLSAGHNATRTNLDIDFIPEAIGATRIFPRLRDAFLLPSNCWDLRLAPIRHVLVHSFLGGSGLAPSCVHEMGSPDGANLVILFYSIYN